MILLLGDWVPEQNPASIEINTLNEFILMNLEGPVLPDTSGYVPINKVGPHLFSTNLPAINDAAVVSFSLANNHINDYGWPGIQTTQKLIKERNYHQVGVGENEYLAREPLMVNAHGYRYAIISTGETQAGHATPAKPGYSTIGPWIFKSISDLRTKVDKIIISVHGGNEFVPWPSPFIQDLYHSYIDAGADIIHGHHSHIPQGVERYKHGLICYGLGNFMGSPARYTHPETQLSLGVRITSFSNQVDYQIETYCFQQRDDCVAVSKSENDQIKSYLAIIHEPLSNRALLEAVWQEVALWLYDKYGRDSITLPYTTEKRYFGDFKQRLKSIGRRMSRRFTLTMPKVRQNQILWYHIFACMSHKNMMETALGLLCGEITDVRNQQAREMVAEYLPKFLG